MATKKMDVRVRIAPSPTGHLHIGNLRAALFNWLFARHQDGVFLIRIEDTDYERSKKEYADSIIDILTWFGLTSDEPIVYQSERTDLYKQYIERLLASGNAYWSDPVNEENGLSVVRFKVDRTRDCVSFKDLIRGVIAVPVEQIDDFVIARADGTPLYNFVVVIDDMLMNISHIIRGEDHISNTARQILLYEALGVTIPQFAHLSLILGSTGAPLSKRDAVTAVMHYRNQGYLADALCNYLVRLSWSHGDQEIFSRKELVSLFSLDDINKSGAIFDAEKLAWFNGVYIRATSAPELFTLIVDDVNPAFAEQCSRWKSDQMYQLIDLYKDRMVTLKNLSDCLVALHHDPDYSVVPQNENFGDTCIRVLDLLLVLLETQENFDADSLKLVIKNLCKEHKLTMPAVAQPIRFALTGVIDSPSIFDLMACLGKYSVVNRIRLLKIFLEKIG